MINNFIYADDKCVLYPSANGMHSRIYKFRSEAKKLNIVYNEKKTVCVCVQPQMWKLKHLPKLFMDTQ